MVRMVSIKISKSNHLINREKTKEAARTKAGEVPLTTTIVVDIISSRSNSVDPLVNFNRIQMNA